MSRLTDLIAHTKTKDPVLGEELEREFRALSSRLAFGLNFERHRPESVELSGRPIRKGDKVRVLQPRGSTAKSDEGLWKVLAIKTEGGAKLAEMEMVNGAKSERKRCPVEDLIVV